MSYTIPKRLQYEEKIVFGLTFKQLFYLTVSSLLALGFMFFDFSEKIRYFLEWYRFKSAWLMEPSMEKFVGIEKITDGVVYVWNCEKPTTGRNASKKQEKLFSKKIGLS